MSDEQFKVLLSFLNQFENHLKTIEEHLAALRGNV